LAGNGKPGFSAGFGTNATFHNPTGIGVDSKGNIIVADCYNDMIRKISPDGQVTVLAGHKGGYVDGMGTVAKFNQPDGLAIDENDNVYVCDTGNYRIRKITAEGEVTTLAGNGERCSVDGEKYKCGFRQPIDITQDGEGKLYVNDNYSLRFIV